MTDAQELALRRLCQGFNVRFRVDDYHPQFDLPEGYVAGWVGGYQPTGSPYRTIYVGVSPEGEVSS